MNKIMGTILTLIAAGTLTGCGGSKQTGSTDANEDVTSVTPNGPTPAMDDHDHGTHGPHGGDLIELGKASFHGELLFTDKQVTIYVLGEKAKESVALDAPELTVSIKHDGSVQSYSLAADPQPEDSDGKSSRFTSQDVALVKALEAGAEGAIVVEAAGKSYTGTISHDHDHDHEEHSH